MHPLAVAAVVLALVAPACAGDTPPGEEDFQAWNGPLIACEDPRPQDCSFDITELVCGRRHATWRTYRNPCTACRDEAVTGYHVGSCHNDPALPQAW